MNGFNRNNGRRPEVMEVVPTTFMIDRGFLIRCLDALQCQYWALFEERDTLCDPKLEQLDADCVMLESLLFADAYEDIVPYNGEYGPYNG